MNGLRIVRFGLKLAAKEKMRRHQYSLQRQLDAFVEGVAAIPAALGEGHEATQFLPRDWSAISAFRESIQDRAGGRGLVSALRLHCEDALVSLGMPLHIQWALDLQPFHYHCTLLLRTCLPSQCFRLGQTVFDAANHR